MEDYDRGDFWLHKIDPFVWFRGAWSLANGRQVVDRQEHPKLRGRPVIVANMKRYKD